MRSIALLTGMLLTSLCQADSFCFAQAQSYYEQLYCEVKAKGKGKNLPRFDQFRSNNQLTQALLLKRPAGSAGVEIVMPKAEKSAGKIAKPVAQVPAQSTSGLENCSLNGLLISCGGKQYRLLGNRANRRLSPGALDEDNRLELPRYEGAMTDRQRLYPYLLKAYRHYIGKMVDIGLAGATMSYGKFEYLFADLHAKGISFHDRFETMFRYLKKDKRSIAVNEGVSAPDSVGLDDCAPLDRKLIACVASGRNYLYAQH